MLLLRRGDSGDAVKKLQRGLNRLGSILLVDGDFGPGTCDAVVDARLTLQCPGPAEADDAFQTVVQAIPDPFSPLSAAGFSFIARAEVSGPREYRLRYTKPVWPSAESGITIGIGYDLQFVSSAQLRADWGRLPSNALAALARVLSVPGSVDRLAQVRDVTVPLLDAMAVFVGRTLPRFVDATQSIYPQFDSLPLPRRTALVSLVYNRGSRLQDQDHVRQERREMRAIQKLLSDGRFDELDDQFEEMTRLWDPGRLPGLVQRRRDEAKLWRSGFAALQLA